MVDWFCGDAVNILSRIQFAFSTIFHFIFVDLTLGLGLIIALTETMYVRTNSEVWKKSAQFWGVLFGLNFAIGAATGLPLEFQFGTNWAFYSHYAGDVFGSILAMEGMIAFFLESTLLGIFFFGWNRVSKGVHLLCTWLLFIASNFSALFILIANGWMQNPIGTSFNTDTMRMELNSFREVFFNLVAQCKFVHTLYSGYVYASVVVISVSAYYLLTRRNVDFAKKNVLLGSALGFASSIALVITGDSSGFIDASTQPMKVAAVEAMWEQEPAPAPLTLIGWPDYANMKTHYAIQIPKVLGLLLTRSMTQEVPGIRELREENIHRIGRGLLVVGAMKNLKSSDDKVVARAREVIEKNRSDYGYALLLHKYREDIINATADDIKRAADDTVPNVPIIFFAFRIMVGLGFLFVLFFMLSLFMAVTNKVNLNLGKTVLYIAIFFAPLPLVAAQCGWIVAEVGRQPWSIEGILPTFLSGSNIAVSDVLTTLISMVILYTILLCVTLLFMFKHIKRGDVC